MSFIADLHIHSHFSRATSKDCTLEYLYYWAQHKGVRVVGTGDCTHPAWFAELKEKLVESGPGLFRLHPEIAKPIDADIPESCRNPVDFIITGEISSIYKRDDRVRKIHSVILLPDLNTTQTLNKRLDTLGNIKSDGRPILGLDPRILLDIMLEANADSCLIPAHIWTPWFSMLGSKSGFDSTRECFGDLSKYIFAVETGLSSDPPMNWRVSSLDDFCLVSNSDAHSPSKLGRNANIFHCKLDFFSMKQALQNKDQNLFGGTIDMFPEEGKYHFDGHRKCDVCLNPEESRAHDFLCPVCGQPLVLGVLHRVNKLADRPEGVKPSTAMPHEHIIPLAEILSEIYSCGPATKTVTTAYHRLLRKFGPELKILRDMNTETLQYEEPSLLCEAIQRLRKEKIIKTPGFDGKYGVIRVFEEGEMDKLRHQCLFFNMPATDRPIPAQKKTHAVIRETPASGKASDKRTGIPDHSQKRGQPIAASEGLTHEQMRAVSKKDAPIIIAACPGTGKTRTLTYRIVNLISQHNIDPQNILAVTFTNRAANEMRERIDQLLGNQVQLLTITTFHSFCLRLLRRYSKSAGMYENFTMIDQEEESALLQSKTGMTIQEARSNVKAISDKRHHLEKPSVIPGFQELEEVCAERHLLSLDMIIPSCVMLLKNHPDILNQVHFDWICIDEYQDINKPQYELIRLISPNGKGLCVIGDPDQSIYAFRGSDVHYFLQFTQDFPNAEKFELSQNFRSSGTIVKASRQVINPGKTSMSVAAESILESGLRIQFHKAASALAEAEFITHEIEKQLGGTAFFSMDSDRVTGYDGINEISFDDIAVLVRIRALIQPLANALTQLGLPVQTVADPAFIEHAGARQVINALRHSTKDTLTMPAGQVLSNLAENPTQQSKLDKTGQDAFNECYKLAEGFTGTLRDFLDHLLLRQGSDRYNNQAQRIAIMTMHAAKGLEFPVVFIAGCEDGILPYVRKGEKPDMDEERRLLYVGMTRAKQVLYITSARKRSLFGKTLLRHPSPFVHEIEQSLCHHRVTAPRKKQTPEKQLEFNLFA